MEKLGIQIISGYTVSFLPIAYAIIVFLSECYLFCPCKFIPNYRLLYERVYTYPFGFHRPASTSCR